MLMSKSRYFEQQIVDSMNDDGITIPGINRDPRTGKRTKKLTIRDLRDQLGYMTGGRDTNEKE